MIKAYLDPNIINWSRRSRWSGSELRNRLAKRDLDPHFGFHGIYELARGLLLEGSQSDARNNFAILSELDPIIEPTPEMLFNLEVECLRTGAVVLPVLDNLNRTSAKQQILQMAAGRLESSGRELIEAREERVSRDHPTFSASIVSQVASAVASGIPRLSIFEEAVALFDPHVPGIIRQILGRRVTEQEAHRFHSRLDEFPALRTTVRANLYLWAIPLISGGTGASTDKNDDYRHVIEGSYCGVFVTGDNQLANTVPRLHPELSVLTWRSLEG